MPFEEDVVAKTFDIRLDDFKNYNFKGDIDILEKFRYIDSQFDLVYSRLNNLIRLFSSGSIVLDSNEGIKKVEELEKEIIIDGTKLNFYVVYYDELQNRLNKIKTSFQSAEIRNNIIVLAKRIGFVEAQFGIKKDSEQKNVFLNLINHIQNLRKRVEVQEEILTKLLATSEENKVEEIKEQISTEL